MIPPATVDRCLLWGNVACPQQEWWGRFPCIQAGADCPGEGIQGGLSSQQLASCWQVFQAVAYKGKKPGDLLAGLEEFLEQVKVLPASQWDPSIRIKPPAKVPPQVGAAGREA